jgi:hypothetical protein
VTDPAPIDFGSGVIGYRNSWAPDRTLNPRWAHLADVAWCGLELDHPDARDPSKRCDSGLLFDLPEMAEVWPDRPRWQVVTWDPLTLSPSILCDPEMGGCGLHGHIREGRWVA